MILADSVVVASMLRTVERHIKIDLLAQLVTAMQLPSGRRAHRSSTKDIIRSKVFQRVKSLLLSPKEHRYAWHDQDRDEKAQVLALCAICEAGPSENILVGCTKHVTGIKLTAGTADEVVCFEDVLPMVNPVNPFKANRAI